MAEVWEAVDDILGRPVAVKVLHPHLAADESFRERFRREAIAAARLAHPNVVATFDTGTDDGITFIVMELVDGPTLRQVLNETGPMAPGRVVHIGAQVADALHYAHRAGVVHRDVKPANILVCPDGRVKVADFGIAKAVEESEPEPPAARPRPSPARDRSSAPPSTCRPSRSTGGRSTAGPTSTPSASSSTRCCAAGRRSPATPTWPSPSSTSPPTRRRPGAVRAGIPRALEEIVLRAMAKAPEAPLPVGRRAADRPAGRSTSAPTRPPAWWPPRRCRRRRRRPGSTTRRPRGVPPTFARASAGGWCRPWPSSPSP